MFVTNSDLMTNRLMIPKTVRRTQDREINWWGMLTIFKFSDAQVKHQNMLIARMIRTTSTIILSLTLAWLIFILRAGGLSSVDKSGWFELVLPALSLLNWHGNSSNRIYRSDYYRHQMIRSDVQIAKYFHIPWEQVGSGSVFFDTVTSFTLNTSCNITR
jgi:hypothetical protein